MKSKLLPVLLFLLILLNGFLIFMLVQKPHEKQQNRPERNFLIEQLQFTKSQKDNFLKLDRIHRDAMLDIDRKIIDNKDVLFNSFSKENFNVDTITSKIGALQAKKEVEVFTFFSKVRKLCTEKQVVKFDKIINQALNFGDNRPSRKGNDRPPPRERGNRPPPR